MPDVNMQRSISLCAQLQCTMLLCLLCMTLAERQCRAPDHAFSFQLLAFSWLHVHAVVCRVPFFSLLQPAVRKQHNSGYKHKVRTSAARVCARLFVAWPCSLNQGYWCVSVCMLGPCP